jgi:hypothetical protein
LSKGYGELQRIIREEEPVRPSTKVSTLGEELTVVAKQRRTSPEQLCKLMRTDLDWIVMKTLEKDRRRRYESVSEFAADIRRHLDNEPVHAGRPSTLYRVKKFVKRNTLLVSSAATVAAVLVLATAISIEQMARANRATRKEKAISSQLAATTREAQMASYAAHMNLASQAIAVDNLGWAKELLDRQRPNSTSTADLRGWEWRYLWKRCQVKSRHLCQWTNTVQSLAVSPDGKRLAIGGANMKGGLSLWRAPSLEEIEAAEAADNRVRQGE